MASKSASLLRKLLTKYGGIPNEEAVILEQEIDEIRIYDTAAALAADVANVAAGRLAYAVDTEALYLRGASAFIQMDRVLSYATAAAASADAANITAGTLVYAVDTEAVYIKGASALIQLDRVLEYSTDAALVADTANITTGSLAYADDTEALYLKAATTLVQLDRVLSYSAEADLITDTANITAGSLAYGVDTEVMYVKGASALQRVSNPNHNALMNQTVNVTLSNAEIKGLAGAQKELVAAVAGHVILLNHITFRLNAGSEALTESDDDLQVRYVDASGVAATGAIEATGLMDQVVDTYAHVKGIDIAAGTVAQLVNTALVLDNDGDGEYGGNASNDATLDVWVNYSLLAVS